MALDKYQTILYIVFVEDIPVEFIVWEFTNDIYYLGIDCLRPLPLLFFELFG